MKSFFPIILFFCCIISLPSVATHIKGGELTYVVTNTSTKTVRFTLTLYRDREGVQQEKATLNFGDNTACQTVDLAENELIDQNTEKLVFYFTHLYASDGSFVASFNEENRNSNIVNIADGNSVDISFHIESKILIGPASNNHSFQFSLSPILQAYVGKQFNIGTIGHDPDGDSLVFKLIEPKHYAAETPCGEGTGSIVPQYKLPDSLTVNPFSGNLSWLPKGRVGEYALAIKVEEYKNNVLVGFVVRDFQINLENANFTYILETESSAEVLEYNVINLKEGEHLHFDVKFKSDVFANLNLIATSELLEKNLGSFEVMRPAVNEVVGHFNLHFTSAMVRENPYILTLSAFGEHNSLFRTDLSFILNPKAGKVFVIPQNPPVDPLGVENFTSVSLSSFPNPATAEFFLNTSGIKSPRLILYDAKGKEVLDKKLERNEKAKVLRNNLPAGAYYYNVFSGYRVVKKGKLIFK